METTDSGERRQDPRVERGAVLRHRTGGAAVISDRRPDRTGWFVVGGGGISYESLISGDWFFVAESVADLVTRFERAVLSDIEARNPGIDVDEVQAHRDSTAVLSGGDARPSSASGR